MTLVALDWNASRVRALLGPAEDYPLPVPLEPPALELAMTLSLESSQPQVGAIGRRLRRAAPHLACHDFLAYLEPHKGRVPTWKAGRQPLSAAQAVTAVWQRLSSFVRSAHGAVVALPGYLRRPQADTLRTLGEKLRLPVLGSIPTPLAAALHAHAEQFWTRSVLVIDVDDHALTLSVVKAADDQAHLVETRPLRELGLKHWHDRFVAALADLCVWQTRRDPRDTPSAEQSLFEQLDALFESVALQRAIQLAIQTPTWYHHILLQPEQACDLCVPLVEQALAEAERLAAAVPGGDFPAGIILTHQAGLLPGLADAARLLAQTWAQLPEQEDGEPDEDFGAGLIQDIADELAGVMVLPPEAPGRAAHRLAGLIRQGDLPRGHMELLAPLPPPQAVDAGPARLHFRGQDYFLREPRFVLGSQTGCHLRFDAVQHPEVAARHCEIVFDDRTFILLVRGREETLVNDHPVAGSVTLRAGDWIRLGLGGPAIRFLGRPSHRPMPTPA